jgi:hypothetical protein
MLRRVAQSGGDEQGPDLVSVEPCGMRLIVDARSADVDSRRVGQHPLLFVVAVEVGHRAQPSGHRRPIPPAAFQLPGERLDVRPSDLEQIELMVVAPADELAEIKLVGVSVKPL